MTSDTSELKHEFEYGIYEDVFKTEELMAELKHIDEAENESKKLRDLEFRDFPLEQFSDAGKVANEGDPHLKAAADTKLYDLEKRAIQIDIDNSDNDKSSEHTDDMPAELLMNILVKTQLVTCNHKLSAINTMLNMMTTHRVKQYTDQHMSHTMKTAKNFCCCKPWICLIKTTSNFYIIHNLKVCVIMSMKAWNKAVLTLKHLIILIKQVQNMYSFRGFT